MKYNRCARVDNIFSRLLHLLVSVEHEKGNFISKSNFFCSLCKHQVILMNSRVQARPLPWQTFFLYVEVERDIYWDREKNKEIILSSLQDCFVITHLSGDFIVKNILNHRLYTLQIFKFGVVVNFNALFNCYAVKLSVAAWVHYVYWVKIIQVGGW